MMKEISIICFQFANPVSIIRFNLHLLPQNGMWVKFYHIWPKNNGEMWSGFFLFFFKFIQAETIFYKFILLHRNETFSTKLQIHKQK